MHLIDDSVGMNSLARQNLDKDRQETVNRDKLEAVSPKCIQLQQEKSRNRSECHKQDSISLCSDIGWGSRVEAPVPRPAGF
ncbi:hypothetical protein RRG08_037264 [Elysia crispata]|uniref:Uncharacterized protein n=1 Tax=Elysia crispata TaxID=231223 RepID=A0AAE0XXE4_9GAST|nr:hypothetical protein RRG08_037264 [Elysia crispata]